MGFNTKILKTTIKITPKFWKLNEVWQLGWEKQLKMSDVTLNVFK